MSSTVTLPVHRRIAVVFDFDETLAVKTDIELCRHLGLDYDHFSKEYVDRLVEDGFETVLAKAWAYIHYSQHNPDNGIYRETFDRVAQDYPLYPGVADMFGRLRKTAASVDPRIELEFHMITAGFAEIPRATSIAKHFSSIWGGHYHYDADGRICFVKSIVGHAEKVRYLLMIAKGFTESGANGPADDLERNIPLEDWHVPLQQIVYVGDGNSDMQTFGYLTARNGIAIGLHEESEVGEWRFGDRVFPGRRVDNLAAPDYSPDGKLYNLLDNAVRSIAHRILVHENDATSA